MDGIAEYTRQHADSLQYQERGRVSLATGGSHAAHRRYRFARRSQGFSVWLVDDGLERLLHDVDLDRRARGLVGAGMHECGCDRYESAYRFDRNDSFVVQHVVRGPRKDYTSITTYTRSR